MLSNLVIYSAITICQIKFYFFTIPKYILITNHTANYLNFYFLFSTN